MSSLVLVGVQYHPHSPIFVAFVVDGAPGDALADSIHCNAHDLGSPIDRDSIFARAVLCHADRLLDQRAPRWLSVTILDALRQDSGGSDRGGKPSPALRLGHSH